MSQSSTQIRLSLQSKLLLIVVLIMSLAMAGNITIDYLNFVAASEKAGMKRLDILFSTFEQLTERSTRLFEQELSQIPIEPYLAKKQLPDLPKALSTNPNIATLRILNFNGEELRAWGPEHNEDVPALLQQQLINLVRQNQNPVSNIFCNSQCFQSSFVPVVTDEGKTYLVNGVRSLHSILFDFSAITAAQAALINSKTDVLIATNAATTLPLLEEVTQLSGFMKKTATAYVDTSQGVVAAGIKHLDSRLSTDSLRLVLLLDDNNSQVIIRNSLKNSLGAAGVALLLTFMLTYLALRKALQKLFNLSRAIPRLSDSNYDDLRAAIIPYTEQTRFPDEIDQLNLTVLEVADALEEMEASVAKHREDLLHTITELEAAQEFNDALVNDSPLVIAAYTLKGDMVQLNDYGCRLAGWRKSEVANRSVADLILPDPVGNTILDNLKPLTQGRESRAQSEQLIRNRQGSVSYLTWIHARVSSQTGPIILSVGLDVTERRRTENRLRWLSKHDAITDLLNREAFHTEASQLIQQYRDSHRVELMMFDIDNFSSYNDLYGFQHGDNMLRETARYIEGLITCHTIIGRTGTNEFSALLIIDDRAPNTKRIEMPFCTDGYSLRFYSKAEGDSVEVNLTAAIARHQTDGDTVDDLLSNCTATLRTLKTIDRGKVNYISAGFDSRAARQEKLQVQDAIVKALADERFVLLYQPIYNLERERITHCECLVRMVTENGKLLSPAAFMNIAKDNGLMPRIDYLVLKMALRQLRDWADNNIHLKLSVNITAVTFESERFVQQLQKLLDETGASGSQLIFEIVETEAINNLDSAKALCDRLAKLDIQIAFDDFGIGFTSFEYLRDLPVDFIKIDQSFIRYLYKRKSDQLLVKSMVDMALALGKKVVAEGVEDDGSADLLRDMGVHYLQGYYISRPKRVSELDLNYSMPTL